MSESGESTHSGRRPSSKFDNRIYQGIYYLLALSCVAISGPCFDPKHQSILARLSKSSMCSELKFRIWVHCPRAEIISGSPSMGRRNYSIICADPPRGTPCTPNSDHIIAHRQEGTYHLNTFSSAWSNHDAILQVPHRKCFGIFLRGHCRCTDPLAKFQESPWKRHCLTNCSH